MKRFNLIIIFTAKDGTKYGLLIENKIDAPAQVDQAARYIKRGEVGVEQNKWDS